MFITSAAALSLEPCVLETAGMGRTPAKCGSVAVVAGADAPAGAALSITFAVLEATGEKKHPDPVVVLPGGPGQGATELAAALAAGLHLVRRERDVVLFDPRGTGRSHKLECPDHRDLPARLRATDDEELARIAACAARVDAPTTAGPRPRSITTTAIAADLDAVRQALGVERWNVLGVSYGTRLALAYDRAFPGRARTLTLDSPAPFSMIVGETASVDALHALEALDARCEETPGCRGRGLVRLATELRASLDATPREVTLAHPILGAPRTLRLDGKTALTAIQHLLYTEETAALVPPLLTAAAGGDLAPLSAQLFARERVDGTISQPMQLSVLCAEDVPFYGPASPAAPETPATPETPGRAANPFPDMREELKRACAVWPHAEVPASFHDDLPASPTPALVLVGSADPITPERGIPALRKTLQSQAIVVGKGIGHNLLFRGCVPDLIDRFIDAGGVDALDVSCATDLGPFPLFIDPMGPAP